MISSLILACLLCSHPVLGSPACDGDAGGGCDARSSPSDSAPIHPSVEGENTYPQLEISKLLAEAARSLQALEEAVQQQEAQLEHMSDLPTSAPNPIQSDGQLAMEHSTGDAKIYMPIATSGTFGGVPVRHVTHGMRASTLGSQLGVHACEWGRRGRGVW